MEQFFNSSRTALAEDIPSAVSGSTDQVDVDSVSPVMATPEYRMRCGTELMKVLAVTGTTLTVIRGAEGTPANFHARGTTVIAGTLTAESLTLMPFYSQPGHTGADHGGSVFPDSGDQTIAGNLDPDDDTKIIGGLTPFGLIRGHVLQVDHIATAVPVGGATGQFQMGNDGAGHVYFWGNDEGVWKIMAGGGLQLPAATSAFDYIVHWDGTTAYGYNGRTGNPDFIGSEFHTVYNACVGALAARLPAGGAIRISCSSTDHLIPVYGSLLTCDGLFLQGAGPGKRGQANTGGAESYGTVAATIDDQVQQFDVTETATPPPVPFYIVVDQNQTSEEWMIVTARVVSGSAPRYTYSVIRGAETPQSPHTAGATVRQVQHPDTGVVLQAQNFPNGTPFAVNSAQTVEDSNTLLDAKGTAQRENLVLDLLSLDGNGIVDSGMVVQGAGTGNALTITRTIVRGWKKDGIRIGGNRGGGGSSDIYMAFTYVTAPIGLLVDVTAASILSANLARFTTALPHGLQYGDTVHIRQVVPAAYNGDWVVSNINSPTQFDADINATATALTTAGELTTERGCVSVIQGDTTLLYNNLVPSRDAWGMYIATGGINTRVGFSHIGGGGGGASRIHIRSGQNILIAECYIDNIDVSDGGVAGIWCRPAPKSLPHGGASSNLHVVETYFNINGFSNWVHFDGSLGGSFNGARVALCHSNGYQDGKVGSATFDKNAPAMVKITGEVKNIAVTDNMAYKTMGVYELGPAGIPPVDMHGNIFRGGGGTPAAPNGISEGKGTANIGPTGVTADVNGSTYPLWSTVPAFVGITPNWQTSYWVSKPSADGTGFTVHFGTAPGGTGGSVMWKAEV